MTVYQPRHSNTRDVSEEADLWMPESPYSSSKCDGVESRSPYAQTSSDFTARSSSYSRFASSYGGNAGVSARKPSRRMFVIGAAVVAVLGCATCATTGLASGLTDSVGNLKDRAFALVDEAKGLADALKSLDVSLAQQKAHSLADAAVQLDDDLSSGLWRVVELVPVYGSDVKSARALVGIVSDLANQALVPLCDTLAQTPVDSLLIADSDVISVNLPALEILIDAVAQAIPVLRSCIERLDDVDDFHIEQLSGVVGQARETIAPYVDMLDKVEPLLGIVPQLLGSMGPRTYLIVAQANCEIRSTGGFPGSIGFATVDNGTLAIGNFGSVNTIMPRVTSDPFEVSDEEIALFGEGYSFAAPNANFNPHFPRACDLWSQFLQYAQGFSIDGAIALDPVFLQNLLPFFGSVAMDDGTVIDGTNAASALMNDVYWRYNSDNSSQDAYFAEAAEKIMEKILDGLPDADLSEVFKTVEKGIDTRRLTMWMRDEGEEEVLRSIGCTGELSWDSQHPVAGIYLGDESWAKMCWWLDTSLQTQQHDGTTTVTYTLTNTIPDEYLQYYNSYLMGGNPLRRADYEIILRVWLYAPAGGSISNFSMVQGELPDYFPSFIEGSHMGLQVLYGFVRMLPGEQIAFTYDVTVAPDAVEDVRFDLTPICHD